MLPNLKKHWSQPGGFGPLLHVAFPLILSSSAHTVQMFTDRVFLMWYDYNAMAGVAQAGITGFAVTSLFFGTVSYVNTFVAQYTGAERDHRVGPAVWQGIYFTLLAALFMGLLYFAAEPIFDFMKHDPDIRRHEITYFRILRLGAVFFLFSTTLSSFFSGRGKTWLVLWVNVIAALTNVALDYCLIFGHFGFPAWGVTGAAVATCCAGGLSSAIYLILFLLPKHERRFCSRSGWRPEWDLFKRLIRFGGPNGIHIMLDITAFALFFAFIGRISNIALSATTMAFQINWLAFIPMLGMGAAVTILTGQAIGRGQPHIAARTTWNAFGLCLAYMGSIAAGYVLVPDWFIKPYSIGADPAQLEIVRPIATRLLYFVAVYSVFDTGNIIFAGTLKGAGDTRFVMLASIILSWAMVTIPSYICVKLGLSLYWPWAFAAAYVCILAICFFVRFLLGKWKHMRVIETVQPVPDSQLQQLPTLEVE